MTVLIPKALRQILQKTSKNNHCSRVDTISQQRHRKVHTVKIFIFVDDLIEWVLLMEPLLPPNITFRIQSPITEHTYDENFNIHIFHQQ